MYRATTPTHRFIFTNLNPEDFKVLNIYYSQQGQELLKKEKEDCDFATQETEDAIQYVAYVTLSQEETKIFKPRQPVKIQLRALLQDNTALATPEYEVPVLNVINDEVLT